MASFKELVALAHQKNLVLNRTNSNGFKYAIGFAPTVLGAQKFNFKTDSGSLEWCRTLKEVELFLSNDAKIIEYGVRRVTRQDYGFADEDVMAI